MQSMVVDQYSQAKAESAARIGFEAAKNRLNESGAPEFLTQIAPILGDEFTVDVSTDFITRGMPARVNLLGPATKEQRGVVYRKHEPDGKVISVHREVTWRSGIEVATYADDTSLHVNSTYEGNQTDTNDDGMEINKTNFGGISRIYTIPSGSKEELALWIARAIDQQGMVPDDRAEAFRDFLLRSRNTA